MLPVHIWGQKPLPSGKLVLCSSVSVLLTIFPLSADRAKRQGVVQACGGFHWCHRLSHERFPGFLPSDGQSGWVDLHSPCWGETPGSCNYSAIYITWAVGREGGKAAGGGTLKGLGKDMDDHKYGVAFLQISQDFSVKKCPQRDLRDMYRTMNAEQMTNWAELVASFYFFNTRAAQQPMKWSGSKQTAGSIWFMLYAQSQHGTCCQRMLQKPKSTDGFMMGLGKCTKERSIGGH